MDRLAQRLEFPIGQVSPGPAWDRAKLQWPDSRADEAHDRVSNFLEHTADNAVAPFVDDDADDGTVLGVAHRPDDRWSRPLPIDVDALAELLEHRCRRVSVEQRLVLLLDLEARMHDAVRDLAIVRQQQQPLGLAVEPANWDDALVDWHEIHDGVASALVVGRRDVSARFVEQDVAAARVRDEHPVDLDLLPFGVDLSAERGDNDSIDPDTPLGDHLLGLAAGRDAARRED